MVEPIVRTPFTPPLYADPCAQEDALLRARLLELEAKLAVQEEEREALLHQETQLMEANALLQAELELASQARRTNGGDDSTEVGLGGVVAQLQQQLHEEKAKNSKLLVQVWASCFHSSGAVHSVSTANTCAFSVPKPDWSNQNGVFEHVLDMRND